MATDSSTHASNIEEGNSPDMSKHESTIQIDPISSILDEKSQVRNSQTQRRVFPDGLPLAEEKV